MSAALLDPAIETFHADGIDGVIAYRHGLGCAVVIGDPVCAKDQTSRLAEAFRAECRTRDWHTVYTVASESFATWAASHGYAFVEFAREMVVDPRHDLLVGHAAHTLRMKVHRAAREGVVIAEYVPRPEPEHALEEAMEGAVSAWLAARRGPQIYLSRFSLFAGRPCKRWFYARRGEDVVGVLQLIRLDARDGYLLSQLLATPEAPEGTTEALGVTALQALGAERCGYVTWGPAPLSRLGAVHGLDSMSERIGREVFRSAARVFHLDARNEYRRKFPIARTERSYLLFDPPRIGAREVIEVLKAFHAFSGRLDARTSARVTRASSAKGAAASEPGGGRVARPR